MGDLAGAVSPLDVQSEVRKAMDSWLDHDLASEFETQLIRLYTQMTRRRRTWLDDVSSVASTRQALELLREFRHTGTQEVRGWYGYRVVRDAVEGVISHQVVIDALAAAAPPGNLTDAAAVPEVYMRADLLPEVVVNERTMRTIAYGLRGIRDRSSSDYAGARERGDAVYRAVNWRGCIRVYRDARDGHREIVVDVGAYAKRAVRSIHTSGDADVMAYRARGAHRDALGLAASLVAQSSRVRRNTLRWCVGAGTVPPRTVTPEDKIGNARGCSRYHAELAMRVCSGALMAARPEHWAALDVDDAGVAGVVLPSVDPEWRVSAPPWVIDGMFRGEPQGYSTHSRDVRARLWFSVGDAVTDVVRREALHGQQRVLYHAQI